MRISLTQFAPHLAYLVPDPSWLWSLYPKPETNSAAGLLRNRACGSFSRRAAQRLMQLLAVVQALRAHRQPAGIASFVVVALLMRNFTMTDGQLGQGCGRNFCWLRLGHL